MGQWSKNTSHQKRDSATVQHKQLRSDRGSWLVSEFLLQFSFFNINDTLIDHPTSSSSSSTSPTMTSSTVSSDSVARQARRDLCGIDSFPVTVSSEHVERQER